ncbi:hypothetical protein XENORESO_007184 [Xenotaenia resolanae]|uniref:Uncharacterized protein n=1 Tax=Xenotaenia resolanae TaxID=208358 RepID=A0ABV0VXZ8_9TELE
MYNQINKHNTFYMLMTFITEEAGLNFSRDAFIKTQSFQITDTIEEKHRAALSGFPFNSLTVSNTSCLNPADPSAVHTPSTMWEYLSWHNYVKNKVFNHTHTLAFITMSLLEHSCSSTIIYSR